MIIYITVFQVGIRGLKRYNSVMGIHFTKRRGGFLLLQMLIAIAIGMIIYYFSFYRISGTALKDQKAHPENYPWLQEDRIGSGHKHELNELQPYRKEMLFLKARVVDENNGRRGKLELFVGSDGMVAAEWSGEYNDEEKNNFLVMGGSAEGNTDPTMIYKNETGEDRSLLYLITKGNFVLLKTDKKNRVSRPGGKIYVVGWIRPDMSAFGTLHLTRDKVDQTIYNWTARATKMSMAR